MKVDIWSDVVCPWCYVGKRRFESALAGFAHRDEVMVTWHSFELDPGAPTHPDGDFNVRLAAKLSMPVERARQLNEQMTATAAGEGLVFDFDHAIGGNTFDAHRVLHLAHARGRQEEVEERFFRATFTEGRAIGDHATLVALAVDAGLKGDEVQAVLDSDAYAADVRADVSRGRQLGINGVPFFVIDEKYGVSGAQSAEVLGSALNQAWSERTPLTVLATPGGATDDAVACEGDSCAV